VTQKKKIEGLKKSGGRNIVEKRETIISKIDEDDII